MLTLKLIRNTEVTITQGDSATILDAKNGGDELKAHIADCDIKAANVGDEVCHSNMKAVIFFGGLTSYLYPDDKFYITNENGKTIHKGEY